MSASNIYFPTISNRAVYTTPGATSFTVPDDVRVIVVEALGGGGGGGAGDNQRDGGNGGGSSYPVIRSVPVTPGESVSIYVGAGGAGSSSILNPGDFGETTTVTGGSFTLSVFGGRGGLSNVTNTFQPKSSPTQSAGGVAGQSSLGSIGQTDGQGEGSDAHQGGIGGADFFDGSFNYAGGGGGGSSVYGQGGQGGDASDGGTGGGNGSVGSGFGSGGGGGGAGQGFGGNGAGGLVVISW